MADQRSSAPDSSAIRVESDGLPHVLEDTIGLKLANPDANWRQRPDMDLRGTTGYRASIVGRARLIEDLVVEQNHLGVQQYVILGAGSGEEFLIATT